MGRGIYQIDNVTGYDWLIERCVLESDWPIERGGHGSGWLIERCVLD